MLTIQYIQQVNKYHFSLIERRRLDTGQSRLHDIAVKYCRTFSTKTNIPENLFYLLSKIDSESQSKTDSEQAERFPREFFLTRKADITENEKNDGKEKKFAKESIVKARRKILNLVLRNAGREIKFLTLTFSNENYPKNFREGLKKVQDFFKRWQYHIAPDGAETRDARHTLKYIAIPELGGKTRRLHFHAIVIAPYIANDTLRKEIWKQGFLQIKSIRAQKNPKLTGVIAAYVAKYIAKETEMLDGRRRIYYASHNWNSDCNRAIVTEKQAKSCYRYLNSLNNSKYIDGLYITFIDFSNREIRQAPEAFKARVFQFRDALQFFDTDFIKIEFNLNRKIAENFISFLQELKVDIYKSDFMKKSKAEQEAERNMTELLKLYEQSFWRTRTRKEIADDIKKLYPLIPNSWINAILWDIEEHGDQNIIFNNLPLLSRFIDDIDFNLQTCPKMLKSALKVKFFYSLHDRKVTEPIKHSAEDELLAEKYARFFFYGKEREQEAI